MIFLRAKVADGSRRPDQQQNTHRSLHNLRAKTAARTNQLSSQHSETSEMHAAISSLTQTRDTHAEHTDQLKQKLATTRNAIAARKVAVRERRAYLAYQAGFNAPELRFWEDRLGLKVEGAGREDRVRFGFMLDEGRSEAWFELAMSTGYKVLSARPSLDGHEKRVEACVGQMAERENLGEFLKGMREIFLEAMR